MSSYVRPSNRRPCLPFCTPPHCLKKNRTPARSHCCLMRCTQPGRTGLAPGPLSPPTMTQCMPERLILPTFSSSGSILKNLTRAGVPRRSSMRGTPYLLSSTLTPHQICGAIAASRSLVFSRSRRRQERFVRTWYVCQCALSMTLATVVMYSSETASWNRSLILLTNTVFGAVHRKGSRSFSGIRRGVNPCS